MELLILGASARAAAHSALRIGLRPTCLDLFADADLVSACPALRIDPARYPDEAADLADGLPPTLWIYTGAIENRPDLVSRVATRHRLLGNDAKTLRAVRDPLAVAEAVRDAGLPAPGVRLEPTGLPPDGSWLRKPIASGGGRGIHPWSGQGSDPARLVYYQERVEGLPLSATFVGDPSGKARCLGIARQFVGRPGNRFAYRGSLGPWPVGGAARVQVDRLGSALAGKFGLLGLFGVDLILRGEEAWPIEVNPRYTASIEVLEWALGRSLLAEHLTACGETSGRRSQCAGPGSFVAKALITAVQPFRWPGAWTSPGVDPLRFPEVADIPQPGTAFRPGEPVLTVFAGGDTLKGCRDALAARVVAWRRAIRPGGPFRPAN